MSDHELRELYRAEAEFWRELVKVLKGLFPQKVVPQSLVLTILDSKGEPMGATVSLRPAQTASSSVQEFSGPNGTGDPLPPAGPISYASDNAAAATIDPNSG